MLNEIWFFYARYFISNFKATNVYSLYNTSLFSLFSCFSLFSIDEEDVYNSVGKGDVISIGKMRKKALDYVTKILFKCQNDVTKR